MLYVLGHISLKSEAKPADTDIELDDSNGT